MRYSRAVLFDPCFDIVIIWIKQALSAPKWGRFKHKVRILNIFFHGVAADPQLPSDGTLLQPLSVQDQDLQNGLLFFKIVLLSDAEFKILYVSLNPTPLPGGSILNDHFWLTLSRPSTLIDFRRFYGGRGGRL